MQTIFRQRGIKTFFRVIELYGG